jgi:hypothetical protein
MEQFTAACGKTFPNDGTEKATRHVDNHQRHCPKCQEVKDAQFAKDWDAIARADLN